MIEIKEIAFSYGKRSILDDISFDLESGKILAILGNNGCGKSTLIKCINKVLPAKNGKVLVNGEELFNLSRNEVAKRIAYVAQNTEKGRITVYDAILLGRKPYIKWDVTSKDHEKVREMISHCGLDNYVLRYIDELSGGELQKVMLARALVQEPKFLLLDEPTSNLDPYNQYALMKQVFHIAKEHNIAVAVVIHDLNLAMRYCEKFVFVKDKKIYKHGGIEIMTSETIKDIYNLEADIIEHNGFKLIAPIVDNIDYMSHSRE